MENHYYVKALEMTTKEINENKSLFNLNEKNFTELLTILKFSDQFIMIVAKFWKNYLKVLDRFPLRTQIVQTGLIMGAGDAIAQIVIEKKNTYNF